jgi:NADP-dependent 3-hydroxy acid dehydrogenase YdfG
MRLQGKGAIVTGAGGGIGAAICRRFAAEGAALIGVDVDAAALAAMATSVRAAGASVATLVADVAEETTAEAAVARASREFGGLDVLVSNAVWDLPLAPLTRLTLADWRRTMAVNLDGAFLFCKHAIPAMEAGGGGSIILIASQLGRVVRAGRPWYCAAKGALIQLAKAMALDHMKADASLCRCDGALCPRGGLSRSMNFGRRRSTLAPRPWQTSRCSGMRSAAPVVSFPHRDITSGRARRTANSHTALRAATVNRSPSLGCGICGETGKPVRR